MYIMKEKIKNRVAGLNGISAAGYGILFYISLLYIFLKEKYFLYIFMRRI